MAFSKYNDVVEEQMSNGVIKNVERSELDGSGQYISHDAEITPLKSTTKLRVVCDASVKTLSEIRIGYINITSIHHGSCHPNLFCASVLLLDLLRMSLRFITHPKAIASDIPANGLPNNNVKSKGLVVAGQRKSITCTCTSE